MNLKMKYTAQFSHIEVCVRSLTSFCSNTCSISFCPIYLVTLVIAGPISSMVEVLAVSESGLKAVIRSPTKCPRCATYARKK